MRNWKLRREVGWTRMKFPIWHALTSRHVHAIAEVDTVQVDSLNLDTIS